MRVLHVVPSLERSFGGPVQALAGYLRASRLAGIETAVAAPTPPSGDLEWFREQSDDAGEVQTFEVVGGGPMAVPRRPRGFLGTLHGIDIVHVHGLLNAISNLAGRSALRSGRVLVLRPFGTLSPYTFRYRRRRLKAMWLRSVDRHILERADVIHFTTEAEREESVWRPGEIDRRTWVVPPPWMNEVSPGRPRTGRRVLFLSRIHPKKGVDELLDAWPLVLDSCPRASLIVAGSGDRAAVARLEARLVRERSRLQSVSFIGFVSGAAKRELLASADLFVLPSHHENFGVAVIEAVASGLPVVISADVQVADFVVAHGVGIVSDRRPEVLAGAIVRALNDGTVRHRAAVEGPRAVAATYGPRTVADRLRAMYAAARGEPRVNQTTTCTFSE